MEMSAQFPAKQAACFPSEGEAACLALEKRIDTV
jgi:hypothetical protein